MLPRPVALRRCIGLVCTAKMAAVPKLMTLIRSNRIMPQPNAASASCALQANAYSGTEPWRIIWLDLATQNDNADTAEKRDHFACPMQHYTGE